VSEIHEGIGEIIAEKRAFREKARLDLTEALIPASLENLHQKFTASLAAAIRTNGDFSTLSFQEAGREVILKSLQEFASLSSVLLNPFDIKKLHELRIAAKRLRYAIELFAVCWENQITLFAKEISKMQSYLGEVHDCDVWIEDLRQRLLKNHAEDFLANAWLLSQFTKIRTKNYRDALSLWSDWQKNNFSEKLKQTISEKTKE
jgi:CHAD domain-containing protein